MAIGPLEFNEQVGAGIRALIRDRYEDLSLAAFLCGLMTRPGRALYDPGAAKWPPLVLRIAQALDVPAEAVIHGAVAVELIIGALDIVDDLVDDDVGEELPHGRAINGAVALLTLAEVATRPLAAMLTMEQALSIRMVVTDALLLATMGEDRDIQYESCDTVDEAAALYMTTLKSGSLVAMAFRLAGCLGTGRPAVLDGLVELGTHVGTVAQLENDMRGCTVAGARVCSDIRRRKKTLPIVYALQCARDERNDAVLSYFAGKEVTSVLGVEEIQKYLAASGALHYTWVVAEAERRSALLSARRLAETAGIEEDLLVPLVPSLPALAPVS